MLKRLCALFKEAHLTYFATYGSELVLRKDHLRIFPQIL